ncbi:MAG: hypothetical protein LCH54_03200 [Bacteroidetes bacterium]|nr:hypothetical protein [Bacteroidota bacterium]
MATIKIFVLLLITLFLTEELYAQDAGTPAPEGNVITIKVQTIRARIRRPTINLLPERMKPDFSQINNSVESLNQQTKDRPKLDFYIRKDSEFPTSLEAEKVIKRIRN